MSYVASNGLSIGRLVKQDFFRHNLVFLFGSLAIAVFSYLYYPVIGHLVSVVTFGEIQAWISLFMEFGILLTAFGYVITNIVNNQPDNQRKQLLLVEVERLALLISIVFFVGLSAVSVLLRDSLRFGSALPFVALGGLIILNVPATFRTYFLQGEKRLIDVSVAGVIFAAGKLLLSVALVLAGFKIFGVIAGYILAQIANLYYVAWRTKGRLPSLRSSLPLRLSEAKFKIERQALKREMLYGLFILFILLIITILYTSDSIVARRYFTAEQAGFFSGISSVARIVFFVTASVAGVLIASVKITHEARQNLNILAKSLGLIFLLGGLATLAFLLLPRLAVHILIGQKYVAHANLLPWMSLSMLVCSLNNLALSYQIALRRFTALWAAGLGITTLVIAILTHHGSMLQIVSDYLLANLVIFVVCMVQIFNKGSGHA